MSEEPGSADEREATVPTGGDVPTGSADEGEPVLIGVAVPMPKPFAEELERWRAQFGDAASVAIPAHVTLLPPTRVHRSRLGEVERHLTAVAAQVPTFWMWLRGTGTFRPVSPVVFVQVAAGIVECEQLESRVRSGPLARDIQFPYHPHVTVAHDLDEVALDRAFRTLAGYEARFPVEKFCLYEHGDGVWRSVGEFPFVGGSA